MSDVRCPMSDVARVATVSSRLVSNDHAHERHRTSDIGHRTSDIGHRTSKSELRFLAGEQAERFDVLRQRAVDDVFW